MFTYRMMGAFAALTVIAQTLSACTAQSYEAPPNSLAAKSPGHYEWRARPQYGPRAPLLPPVRVWVPDAPEAR